MNTFLVGMFVGFLHALLPPATKEELDRLREEAGRLPAEHLTLAHLVACEPSTKRSRNSPYSSGPLDLR
jgi:hypothetical protein